MATGEFYTSALLAGKYHETRLICLLSFHWLEVSLFVTLIVRLILQAGTISHAHANVM